MKVLHLCTKDFGGAGKAALRLHLGLKAFNVESQMLVLHSSGLDSTVTKIEQEQRMFQRMWNRVRKQLISSEMASYSRSPHTIFTTDRSIYNIGNHPLVQEADIIHLHWIAGMVDYAEFFSRMKEKPIVWTLHDANPFTGGCHIPGTCTRYTSGCGSCPILQSKDSNDLSRRIVERKRKTYQGRNLALVAPSQWLCDRAQRSLLFKDIPIEAIPHSLPVDIFQKRDKKFSRDLLSLPQDKFLILFGAEYKTELKGFKELLEALEILKKRIDVSQIALVTFGEKQDVASSFYGLNFPIYQLGRIHNEKLLSALYSSCDVAVVSSLWEAFGLLCLESMACGTPVVGYSVGGLPEMIHPGKTGLLTEVKNIQGLAEAVAYMIAHPQERQAMGENARKLVEQEYTLPTQARRYLKVYENMLKTERSINQKCPLSRKQRRLDSSRDDLKRLRENGNI